MEQCFTLMILQIFLNKIFLFVKSNFLHYCDVYEHGKLEISVTTSLIMALVIVHLSHIIITKYCTYRYVLFLRFQFTMHYQRQDRMTSYFTRQISHQCKHPPFLVIDWEDKKGQKIKQSRFYHLLLVLNQVFITLDESDANLEVLKVGSGKKIAII